MKKIGRRLIAASCAVAVAVNGVAGVMAQGKKEDGNSQSVRINPQPVISVNLSEADPTATTLRMREAIARSQGYGAGSQGGDSAFQFFSQELSFDNRLVKGAPFSADIVSETVQMLPDGNRIVQRSEGHIYRDGQGRTRQDRTIQLGGSSDSSQTITIFDPVDGKNYILDPSSRTARQTNFSIQLSPPIKRTVVPGQSVAPNSELPGNIFGSGSVLQSSAIKKVQPSYPPIAKAAKASGAVQVQILVNEAGEVIEASVVSGHPLLRDAAIQAARQWVFKPTELGGKPVKVQGVLTFNFTLSDEEPGPAPIARSISKYTTNTEPLGRQSIEGVECEGTRSLTLMPAGAIGNERPIETIQENWFSPELKMMILTKRTDPRFGESTYRVANISRSEPAASLFQVPSEYTIKEGGEKRIGSAIDADLELKRRLEEMQKKVESTRRPDNQ